MGQREVRKSESHFFIHSEHSLVRFFLLISILLGYALFVIEKYGMQKGLHVTLLTWAFFVTATPIADAGFLVDFPLRVLFHIPMRLSEVFVWLLALMSITLSLLFSPFVYSLTPLLRVHFLILTHPWPYWLIILLSALGTFLSVTLADELFDTLERHVFTRREAVLLLSFLLTLIGILLLYSHLLQRLGLRF